MTAGQNVQVTSISQAGGVVNDGNLNIFAGGTIGRLTETGTAGAVGILAGTLQLAPNGTPSSKNVFYIVPGTSWISPTINCSSTTAAPRPIRSPPSPPGFITASMTCPVPQIISSDIAADDAASGFKLRHRLCRRRRWPDRRPAFGRNRNHVHPVGRRQSGRNGQHRRLHALLDQPRPARRLGSRETSITTERSTPKTSRHSRTISTSPPSLASQAGVLERRERHQPDECARTRDAG